MYWLAALLFLSTPDRSDLLDAWIASFPPDAELTQTADGYHLRDESLGYDGPVVIIGTHITEYTMEYGPKVSHQGMVDFSLEIGEELAKGSASKVRGGSACGRLWSP